MSLPILKPGEGFVWTPEGLQTEEVATYSNISPIIKNVVDRVETTRKKKEQKKKEELLALEQRMKDYQERTANFDGGATPRDYYQAMVNNDPSKMSEFDKSAALTTAAGIGLATLPYTIGAAGRFLAKHPLLRTTLDVWGTGDSIKNVASDNGISKTIRLAQHGDTKGAIKSGIGDTLDLLGVTDAFTNPYLRKGVVRLAQDTARSFNDMRNGVQPVFGLTPWRGMSWYDVDGLDQITLRGMGLGQYDVQNLLDRGYDIDQILMLQDTSTPGLSSNRRANALAQRLADIGISPANRSRRQFLEEAMGEGYEVVLDRNWRPLLEGEALGPTNPMPWGWLDQYYQIPTTSAASIYSDARYSSLGEKVADAMRVLSTEDHARMAPQIKKILEEGYTSGKSSDELERALVTLFSDNNKPFGRPRTIHVPIGYRDPVTGEFVPTLDSSGNPAVYSGSYVESNRKGAPRFSLEKALETPNPTSTAIRLNEAYTPDNVPITLTEKDLDMGENHHMLFDGTPDEIEEFNRMHEASLLHGATTIEDSKSLQSAALAHLNYAGEGRVPLFYGLVDPDDPAKNAYRYAHTNNSAHTTWSPNWMTRGRRPLTGGKALRTNIRGFERVLNGTPRRALAAFGATVDPKTGAIIGTQGLPKYQMHITMPGTSDPKIIDLPYEFVDGKFKFETPGTKNAWDEIWKIVDEFDSAGLQEFDGRKLVLKYPLAGSRKLKTGGIIQNINPKISKILNIK